MPAYTPLQMIAHDPDDLQIISACLQDALVPLSAIAYDKESGNFHLVVNRFCWECDAEIIDGNPYYARVSAGLAFHHVKEVQKKDLDLQKRDELVNLLTIHEKEDGFIHFIFSGGPEIKLKVDKLYCHLKDVDEPYSTPHIPIHEEASEREAKIR